MNANKLAPEIEAIVSGPRTPGRLNGAELLLILQLRQAGYDLARDFLTGPNGARFEHKRVIRRRRGAA